MCRGFSQGGSSASPLSGQRGCLRKEWQEDTRVGYNAHGCSFPVRLPPHHPFRPSLASPREGSSHLQGHHAVLFWRFAYHSSRGRTASTDKKATQRLALFAL